MKVIHWTMKNGSGMYRVAESMARGELAIGVDARVFDPFDAKQDGWELTLDADVHVCHTHIPDKFGKMGFRKACTKPFRWVFPVHGTPEHFFEESVREGAQNGYNAGMSYVHHQHGMQQADAILTFVPRHQWLFKLATDKHTIVDCLPMGIDVDFWQAGVSKGKYAGEPAFWTAENQHDFKWCVHLIAMWQAVREELDQAVLHATNVPLNLHRFVFPMLARYGSYGTVVGSWSYGPEDMRNIFKSVDFYLSPVRYGDFNRIALEARAAGTKLVSFPGNEYADFWMPEGDHRATAAELIRIGKGEPTMANPNPRPVATEFEMARAAINVYERILDRPRTNWSLGGLSDAMPDVVREAIASATNVQHYRPAPPMSPPSPPVLTLLDGGKATDDTPAEAARA